MSDELKVIIQDLETSTRGLVGDEYLQAFSVIKALSKSPNRLRIPGRIIVNPDGTIEWPKAQVLAHGVDEDVIPGSSSGGSSTGTGTSPSPSPQSIKCPHCGNSIKFSV